MKNKFALTIISLVTLFAHGCATNTEIKPNAETQQHNQHKQTARKKGICADTKAPPTIQCSETVTATFDHHGKLWIAWVYNDQIYVQFSSDKGINYSAPVAVNVLPEAVAAQNESRPKIQVDALGNIYLSWVLTLDQKRSTYVRFSRSIDGGEHFSPPITVNQNLDVIRHRFDTMATGQYGEILIAWLDARHTEAAKKSGEQFSGLSLYYTWSDDGGQHFHPEQNLADHTCECCRIASAINQQNQPVLSWRHIFEGGIRDHAIMTFKDWQTPGPLLNLGTDNWKIDGCPHHGPGLSISESNDYHAVWFSNSDSKQGLFYAHSNDAGKNFTTPLHFGKPGSSHPHVLALGNRVGVVWLEFDGIHNHVRFIQSVDNGKSWSPPISVAQTTEMLDEPFLVSDNQQLYLSWHAPQQGYHLTLLSPNALSPPRSPN